MKAIKLLHLYPKELNLYGDSGNILCMYYRLKKRGFNAEILSCSIGDPLPNFDIMFIGGGQDREIGILENDIKRKSQAIKYAIEDKKVVLAICGGYQLLGSYYKTKEKVISLCDALPFYTVSSNKRMIGNIVTKSRYGSLVGFENHSGKTYLDSSLNPLAIVKTGFGNNGKDLTEGLEYKNTFCTYLHGPVLPKNINLCDEILSRAVPNIRSYPLDDELENLCHSSLVSRFARQTK